MMMIEEREEVKEMVYFRPKRTFEVRPMYLSEAELKERLFMNTALSHGEFIKSANGEFYRNFNVGIFPRNFFINPNGTSVPEDLNPNVLNPNFSPLSIFEFLNFAFQFKKRGHMKKGTVYVPIGTRTKSDLSSGLIPVCFSENVLNGSIRRSLKFKGRAVIQCSTAPSIQWYWKRQFFLAKIVD